MVTDQVAACAVDRAGGDRPARRRGDVVAEPVEVAGEVAVAGVDGRAFRRRGDRKTNPFVPGRPLLLRCRIAYGQIRLRPGGSGTTTGSGGVTEVFEGDEAIITVPFSGLRHVAFAPPLAYGKRRAITELHYDAATKVLLEFSQRWWEFTEAQWKQALNSIEDNLYDAYKAGRVHDGRHLGAHKSVKDLGVTVPNGLKKCFTAFRPIGTDPEAAHIRGGGSVSDNANRFMYFAHAHPMEGSDGGIMPASYSWSDDALKWKALADDERYLRTLAGAQCVFGRRCEVSFTNKCQTQSWMRDHYPYGEASVLLPGQHTELFPDIPTSEGPLHFAGDHMSIKPAWIEGAVESAVRTALKVHTS